MVKKSLFFLAIFLTCIFGINKVSAATHTRSWGWWNYNFEVSFNDNTKIFTDLNNNTNYIFSSQNYLIYFAGRYARFYEFSSSDVFFRKQSSYYYLVNSNNVVYDYTTMLCKQMDLVTGVVSDNNNCNKIVNNDYGNLFSYTNNVNSFLSSIPIYDISNNNLMISPLNYIDWVQSIEVPDFEFSYTSNQVNNYITSVNLLTTLNFVDDENYNYYYKFGEVVDWRQLYAENFVNNTFSQLIKYNGIFYFKITDKENNVVVAKTFSINNIHFPTKPSIEYDPSYNTEYDTITSVNLLTYFYVYDDENYVCQQKFVDTSQNFNDVDFTTYNCDGVFDNITSNGSVYSRILLNNNIVSSSTYTIFNIGSISPDSDLNFFDRISRSLNYGGPISNMITTPVQILNTIYTAVQFQACEPVSLGILFGHELTLPCIDVESILGHNLYMFIDLVCAFYVAINIIGFILDTYNKLMDLNPDSLDSQKGRGGIFK